MAENHDLTKIGKMNFDFFGTWKHGSSTSVSLTKVGKLCFSILLKFKHLPL